MSFETPLPPYNAKDPYATFLNSSCLDLLLIEMVPTVYRITDELSQRRQGPRVETGLVRSKGGGSSGTGTVEDDGSDGNAERRKEAAYKRLEGVGYRVGQGLVER